MATMYKNARRYTLVRRLIDSSSEAVRAALRLTFLTATLATAYGFLLWAANYALPWVFTPSWWRLSWPTQHSATLAWFQALNVVRTLVAALPISVVIAIFVK